jgi:predicted CxxxxCH...CXXCH cytochrome family protein
MSTNRLAVLSALAGVLALSACDTARPIEDPGGGGGACTSCHGGTDNTTGAPPVDASGSDASPAVGAHTAHVNAQVACTACHGPNPGGSGHNDGQPTEIAFTGTAVADGATPTYDSGSRTCSGVYCHGATRADGTATAPLWTGGTLGCSSCHGDPPLSVPPHTASTTNCGLCHTAVPGPNHVNGSVNLLDVHPAGYSTPTLHGPDAIADIATCQNCHGADFDGDFGPSCNACHDDAGWSATALTTNCTFCHGTKTKPTFDFATAPELAAPPEGVAGATAATDPTVGAHQAHLGGSVLCTECHTVPTGLGHIADGAAGAEIVFGPLAGQGTTPTFDGGTQTCTNYCHGATLAGGTATAPVWTGSGLGCSSCHGNPPIGVAPHSASTTSCSDCHTAVPGPDHVNGTVNLLDIHPAGYADPAVHGPDAIADIASCQGCHGSDFNGVFGPSCNACHETAGWSATALTTNCTFCHGTKTKPTFDFGATPQLAAPPEAVDGSTTGPSVGAHQAHLVGDAYSNGFACVQCHAVPADLAHVADGAAGADFTWGPLAAQGTTPTFDAGALTCTNYCHGATINTTAPLSPAWTASSAACNACHLSRPSTGLHTNIPAHNAAPCTYCHIDYVQDTTVNLAFHVNGARDVVFLRAGGAPGETFTLTTAWTNCSACHGNNANY